MPKKLNGSSKKQKTKKTNDEPTTQETPPPQEEPVKKVDAENEDEDEVTNFTEMGLDERILYALVSLEWYEPTAIQEASIPLILEGKDVLIKARTGSGKTGAYAIPLINKILNLKKNQTNFNKQVIAALILTPSKELCTQATRNINELSAYCQREMSVVDISGDLTLQTQKQLLSAKHDIIVATPARILQHLQNNTINLKESLETLVIDEADLLLSFGYENDMKQLVNHLPKSVQTILLSATLNNDVIAVKTLYLHNPAILKLKDNESNALPNSIQLDQYLINCANEEDKFVILYSILKLNLIKGKSIIFVNTVNRSYKVKLYLDQFGIRTCVLNSELPLNSRMHIIEQYNNGIYDSIIASDEKLDALEKTNNSNKRKDKEYNISRGIDFKRVSNVINFDFPLDTKSYIHRVGRTARGNLQGSALSLVEPNEEEVLKSVENELLSNKAKTNSTDENSNSESGLFKTFNFKMDEIEGFRYRARDVLRSITSVLIKEARLKEIKNELLNSEKLKAYFEENPREAQVLRHDKEINGAKGQEHLRHVPDYIIPPSLRGIQLKNDDAKKERQKRKNIKRLSKSQRKYYKTASDPLKSFKFSGIKKKRNNK